MERKINRQELKKKSLLFLLLFMFLFAAAWYFVIQYVGNKNKDDYVVPEFVMHNGQWADSLLATLTLNEKIAQLIVWETNNLNNEDEIVTLLTNNNFGGIIFSTDSLEKFVACSNKFRAATKIPVFLAPQNFSGDTLFIDVPASPNILQITANRNDSIFLKYAEIVCEQTKSLGANYQFSNLFSTLLLDKEYSREHEEILMQKAIIQNNEAIKKNILLCFQNFNRYTIFPNDSANNYRTLELYKLLTVNKIQSIQLSINNSEDLNQLNSLRNEANFLGLIIADIEDENSVNEDFIKQTLLNGAALIRTSKPKEVYDIVVKLVESKAIDIKLIDAKVKRILQAKKWTNSFQPQLLQINETKEIFHQQRTQYYFQQLLINSLSIIGVDTILPIKKLFNTKIGILFFSEKKLSAFQENCELYANITSELATNCKELEMKAKRFAAAPFVIVVINKEADSDSATLAVENAINELKKKAKFC